MSNGMVSTQVMDGIGNADAFDVMSEIDVPGESSGTISNLIGEENGTQTLPESDQKEEGTEGEEKVESSEVEEESSSEGEQDGVKPIPATQSPSDVKVLTAVHNGKEIKVPEEATFKLKVDNEETEVTLDQLKRSYQGKIPLEKHYRESKEFQKTLEQREASINGQVSALETHIKSIINTYKENPYLAFEMIAEWAGDNPADHLPLYIAQSRKTIEELDKLTDAEFKALQIGRKNKFEEKKLREREDSFKKREEAHSVMTEQQAADKYFDDKAKELNITPNEVNAAVEIFKSANINFKGKKPREVADTIIDYVVNTERKYSKIEEACQAVHPQALQDKEFMAELGKMITAAEPVDNIKVIVKEYFKESKPSQKPKANATSEGESSEGSSRVEVKSHIRTPPRKGEEQERKLGIINSVDVGPMSIHDILRDYD